MTDYGSDIAGVDDFDSELSFVEGPRAAAEALVRRLGSDPGSMEDDPTYGYNLTLLIGDTADSSEVERKVVQQMKYDDRVVQAEAKVTALAPTVELGIRVVFFDGKTFELTVTADAVNVKLLNLQEAA